MPEDIFDIVNGGDEVVGSAPRSEVHSKGFLHRSAHILIFSSGCILLQKRSRSKDLYPGRYTTSCSGHVDSGEDYETASLRELREETGIVARPEDLAFLGTLPPSKETGNEFTSVYTMQIPRTFKFTFSPEEIEGFKWVKVEEFEKMLQVDASAFTPSFVKVYAFYKDMQGGASGGQPGA